MAAGAPLGNQNAIRAKRWSQAIDRALSERSRKDQIDALDALAEKLLTLCDAGDLGALRELGDRIEGKSAQSVMLSGDEDKPLFHKVIREIVRPDSPIR